MFLFLFSLVVFFFCVARVLVTVLFSFFSPVLCPAACLFYFFFRCEGVPGEGHGAVRGGGYS